MLGVQWWWGITGDLQMLQGTDVSTRELQFVLLPGLHGTGELWQPFVDAAPPATRLIPCSYPSEVPSCYASLEAHVRSMLPERSPFVLVAESFSGPVGIRIAASPPKNMWALVLCNTFAAPPFARPWSLFPWKTLFRIPGPSPLIRRYFVGRSASDEQVRQVRDLVLRADPAVLAARVRLVLATQVREKLAQVGLPVLYLRGTRDRLVPDRALTTIREVLPSVTPSFVPAPHFILQMAPTASWESIEWFLHQRLDATSVFRSAGCW